MTQAASEEMEGNFKNSIPLVFCFNLKSPRSEQIFTDSDSDTDSDRQPFHMENKMRKAYSKLVQLLQHQLL